MKDETQALLYLAAAGAVFLLASKLFASPRTPGLSKVQKIACLGDSITAEGVYCHYLAGMLGVEARAFGYPSQGANVIYTHVEEALAWNPDAVVVLAGVNDLHSSTGAMTAIEGLKNIYEKIHAAGAYVVAVEITPWHGYPSAAGYESNTYKVNSWIRREANVDAVVKTSSLGDSRGNLKPEYDNGSGLHPNREGQAELAVLIADQAFGR